MGSTPPPALVLASDPKPPTKRKRAKPRPAKTAAVWEAYAEAYEQRYGVLPLRNAAVNGQLAKFIDAVGADDAPEIARFFLSHNSPYYVRRGHTPKELLGDAHTLRTQWLTGRKTTSGDVKSAEMFDEMAAKSERVDRLLEQMG